ncbi:MAG: helix-turn-helix domain-containing protein [Alphaproteobacteria bacterium]|nr:helix-turn-helix domain-containing protein [Alphaproteobacteria bacterium]
MKWVQARMALLGLRQIDVGEALGLDASAVSRLLSGKRKLLAGEASALAGVLQVAEDALLRGIREPDGAVPSGASPAGSLGGSSETAPALAAPTTAGSPLRDVPIRSGGRSGHDQEMFLEDGPVGYTTRPPNLIGVKGAYAIYNMGDSMSPRYEAGWLLHVNPFKPAAPGRDVVVVKRNNAVLIKQLVKRAKGRILLRSHNRDYKDLEVDESEVLSVHLIVGSDQEGG